MGNSIVAGLSTKSNAQNEKAANQRGQQAYEQAIAAGIPDTQAKLLAAKEVLASVSPGKRPQVDINETDDALSVSYLRGDKSKGGITLTNTNSLTAIGGLTSWISDEGLWGNNDVVKLATGLLDRRAVATQYMIDQATHDINYYTMSSSNGGNKINGNSGQGVFIPWRPDLIPQPQKMQSPLERFNKGQRTTPGPWADGYVWKDKQTKAPEQNNGATGIAQFIKDYSGDVGTAIGIIGDISTPVISNRLLGQAKAAGNTIAAGPSGTLNAYQRGLLQGADTLADATAVFSSSSKSGQAITQIANSTILKGVKKLPLIGNVVGGLTIPTASYLAEPGNGYRDTVAASVSFGAGWAIPLAVGGAVALVASTPLAIGAGVLAAGAYAFGGGDDYVEQLSKDFYDYLRNN